MLLVPSCKLLPFLVVCTVQVLRGLAATHRAEFALALTRIMAGLLEAREAEVEVG